MMNDIDQQSRDDWQTRLYEAARQFSVQLKELRETNPWPEHKVLDLAINTLATELWDRCFSLTEIKTALNDAATDLPRYAAGEEMRP